MMRINLLPHRQIRREARQKQFVIMMALSATAAAIILFLGYSYFNLQIENQNQRNSRLSAAIAKLDKEIVEIKVLKEKISDVLGRKQAVESLQTNRSQVSQILDEISRKLPEGMYITAIKQAANLVSIDGVADTNARVATLVRNFKNSEWLETPNLVEIKSNMVNDLKTNNFKLNVNLKPQNVPSLDKTKKKVEIQ